MSLVYPLLVVHCIVHVYANYIPANYKNRGKFYCVENICCVLRVNSCMQRLYWSQRKQCWYMYHWLVEDPFQEAFLSSTNNVEQHQQQELQMQKKKVLLRGIGHNNAGVSLVVDPFTESMLLIIFLSTKPAANTSITNNNQKQK